MIRLGLFSLLTLVFAWQTGAHTVPSVTLEVVFGKDRSFELRANIDPRLILSDNPTKLPPVEAAWYREQTPDQLKSTFDKAHDYLLKSIILKFGGKELPWPATSFQPMDGSTSSPLTNDTLEVHLLATVHGTAPEGEFQVSLGNAANTSLILLNSFDGKTERRPQVIFAGETTRPFSLPTKNESVTSAPTTKPADAATPAANDHTWGAWFIMAVAALWGLRRVVRNFRSA